MVAKCFKHNIKPARLDYIKCKAWCGNWSLFVCRSSEYWNCFWGWQRIYLSDSLSKSSPIQVKGWTATKLDTSTSWTSWVEANTISLQLAWKQWNKERRIRMDQKDIEVGSNFHEINQFCICKFRGTPLTLFIANAMIISDSLWMILALPPG